MTSTIKRFQWIDRDTAARNLLQLVYHAPEEIRRRALRLLMAIRSPAVIVDLQAIVYDEQYSSSEREVALNAIIGISGDIYMPELRPYLQTYSGIRVPTRYQVFRLADKHPSNRTWLFEYIDQLSPRDVRNFIGDVPESMAADAYDRLIAVIEANPSLLDLGVVRILRYNDQRESTQAWLAARWQQLVYLCLTTEIRELVLFLEHWEELRNIVFFCCPMIVLEYHPVRAGIRATDERINKLNAQRRSAKDFMQSNVWREREQLYLKAIEGDEKASHQLARLTSSGGTLEKAVAVYFLGKLPDYPNFIFRMISLLRFSLEPWMRSETQYRSNAVQYPVALEAAYALSQHPSPEVWEALVNAYFGVLGPHPLLHVWIAYQTDVLSGLDVAYPSPERRLENVPWSHALAAQTDPESKNEL